MTVNYFCCFDFFRKVEMEAHLPHHQDQLHKDLPTDQLHKDLPTDQLKHQAIAMLVGLAITIVMISITPKNVSMMVVTVAKKIPQTDGTIIASKYVTLHHTRLYKQV